MGSNSFRYFFFFSFPYLLFELRIIFLLCYDFKFYHSLNLFLFFFFFNSLNFIGHFFFLKHPLHFNSQTLFIFLLIPFLSDAVQVDQDKVPIICLLYGFLLRNLNNFVQLLLLFYYYDLVFTSQIQYISL